MSKPAALMLFGTGSDAGKSLLAAAFGRIMLQDGLNPAPFKAQNMALNSAVTADGLELGLAQALQAKACGLDADVRMNPVLLKPQGNMKSQIILLGKSIGTMSVSEYHQHYQQMREAAFAAYDDLSREHQVMILEGAGSPAEINLRKTDFVNCEMAHHAGARALLVGDIDRGGVYASFVGTLACLSERDRSCFSGFLVNKFRGDASLLQDAHEQMLARTGHPVLGVIPFIEAHGLPQEDSVAMKSGAWIQNQNGAGELDIVLLDLGLVANYHDFDPLLLESDCRLRRVEQVYELGNPDLIILPGSKNTFEDYANLRRRGFTDVLAAHVDKGCVVLGICGGLQIMGSRLSDPLGIEGRSGQIETGLGLLAIQSSWMKEKQVCQSMVLDEIGRRELIGYEIHHGQSVADGRNLVWLSCSGRTVGWKSPDLACYGTYIHGIFDNDDFRRDFLDRLRARKGLSAYSGSKVHYDLQPCLNRLADIVREAVDMNGIYKLLGI